MAINPNHSHFIINKIQGGFFENDVFEIKLTDQTGEIQTHARIDEHKKGIFSFLFKEEPTVKITLKDYTDKIHTLNVKVNDLAKLLHVSVKKIHHMKNYKVLDDFVSVRIEANLINYVEDRQHVMNELSSHGLPKWECTQLGAYYQKHKKELDQLDEPEIIHRHKDLKLPRSILSIPNGPLKGMYALLKTHGNIQEVGRGAHNKATLAVNLETGETFVFRSGRKGDVKKNERIGNELASQYPDFFVAGPAIQYKGNIRDRNRDLEPKYQRNGNEIYINKVGFLLPYQKGGDLFEKLSKRDAPSELLLQIAKECALGVHHCHTVLHLVHRDLKSANILLTSDNHAKIGDFGFAVKEGNYHNGCGTFIYMSPEIFKAKGRHLFVDAKQDIWSLGIMYAEMFHYPAYEWLESIYKLNIDKDTTEADYEAKKGGFLNNRNDETHPDYVINQCLQLDPKKRPTAAQIVNMWKKVVVPPQLPDSNIV